MIRVRKVCKDYQTSFGANHVLRDVSFDLRKGEKLGILGRNGAGKSTLMRLVSGAEMPSSGTIDRSMSVSWPLAFGGAFQTMLTGRDNVRFISRIYDQDFERNLAFVEDFAGLGPYLHEPVRTYSSGMRARLAFAISMITEFDCFLIDEVGAVGDARFHERCNHELFVRRADRAMIIISHDAAYLRDHCTRFAVLHDARLRQMTDFDEAYGEFRRLVGLAPDRQPVARVPIDRTRLIEASQTRALRDERFTLLVQDGDMHRDARRWPQAEAAYAEALALYPYQRSYWVQHAHVAKEQGHFALAEVSYRSACALGEPLPDVREHLEFVVARQGDSPADWPLRDYAAGSAAAQTPALSDLTLFAALLWGTGEVEAGPARDLLRLHASCDALLAAMIDDPRFAEAQAPWIAARREGADMQSSPAGERPPQGWADALACIACPATDGHNPEAVARSIAAADLAWAQLIAAGGFAGWTLSQAALQRHIAA